MTQTFKIDNYLAIKSDCDISQLLKGVEMTDAMRTRAESFYDELANEYRASMRLGIADGVAYINVSGVICNCDAVWAYFMGWCSTSELYSAVIDYAADQNVKRICLMIDSPGGEVNGITEIVDAIANSGKETMTIIRAQCCSAAYWLASATDMIYAHRGSCVGSIGVYVAWDNITELYAKAGIKTEFYASGELKGVGVESMETTDAQKAFVNSHVMARFNQFKSDILRKREVGVESMNGGFWLAQEAMTRKLIDGII